MSIFPSQRQSPNPGPGLVALARYVVPSAGERILFAQVAHAPFSHGRVRSIRKLSDGTYQIDASTRDGITGFFVDAVSLRQLATRVRHLDDLVRVDRDIAAQYGSVGALPPQARHRIAQQVAARRAQHHEAQGTPSTTPDGAGPGPHPGSPEAIYAMAYTMGTQGASVDHLPQPLRNHDSFRTGYAAGKQAAQSQGTEVSYGAGALDSVWADITRGSVDASSTPGTCPKDLAKTTDYSKCTCQQLAAKKAYWQAKEFATPLGDPKRLIYGTRVHALAMFEATCDQVSGSGCTSKNPTTDYSKLDCGCLEAKRRYWVDEAGKQVVLSGKRETYEARANHIATFKATCGQNKTSESSTSASTTTATPTTATSSSVGVSSFPAPVAGSSLSAPVSFASAAGLSATNALIHYSNGDPVTARQHALAAKSYVDRAVAAGQPFPHTPRVHCAVTWAETGVMPARCTGVAPGPVPMHHQGHGRPVLRPGVAMTGPIYSRPHAGARPAIATHPAILSPPGTASRLPSGVGVASTSFAPRAAAVVGPRMVHPNLRGAVPATARFNARMSGVFGSLDRESMIEDAASEAFGAEDTGSDLFGASHAALDPLFNDDGV